MVFIDAIIIDTDTILLWWWWCSEEEVYFDTKHSLMMFLVFVMIECADDDSSVILTWYITNWLFIDCWLFDDDYRYIAVFDCRPLIQKPVVWKYSMQYLWWCSDHCSVRYCYYLWCCVLLIQVLLFWYCLYSVTSLFSLIPLIYFCWW